MIVRLAQEIEERHGVTVARSYVLAAHVLTAADVLRTSSRRRLTGRLIADYTGISRSGAYAMATELRELDLLPMVEEAMLRQSRSSADPAHRAIAVSPSAHVAASARARALASGRRT